MKQKFITILKLITSRGNRNNSLKKKIYIYIYIYNEREAKKTRQLRAPFLSQACLLGSY